METLNEISLPIPNCEVYQKGESMDSRDAKTSQSFV